MSKKKLNRDQLFYIYTQLLKFCRDSCVLDAIFPCMKLKNTPRLNHRFYHYLVFYYITNKPVTETQYPTRYTDCDLCGSRQLYGTVQITYLKYAQTVPLCINCKCLVDARVKYVTKTFGEKVYYIFLRKFALLIRLGIPSDIIGLIINNIVNLMKLNLDNTKNL